KRSRVQISPARPGKSRPDGHGARGGGTARVMNPGLRSSDHSEGTGHTAQSVGRVVVGDDKVMQKRLGHLVRCHVIAGRGTAVAVAKVIDVDTEGVVHLRPL